MKDSLFSQQALGKIRQIRKIFLWTAVWILIGEVILGAVLILGQNWNLVVGKVQATFFILAISLFVGVNNFIRMEKGDKLVQGFAIVSFIANIFGTILAVLLIWEAVPFYWYEEKMVYPEPTTVRTGGFRTVSHITSIARMMLVSLVVAMAGFWISNVLAIKDTVKPVKPLKMTAIVCVLYYSLFFVVAFLLEIEINEDTGRWYALAGLASLAFVITALAALVVSSTGGKEEKKEKALTEVSSVKEIPTRKTDDELRAEIEEQVRREMIEKEVRARMEAEKAEQENKEQ